MKRLEQAFRTYQRNLMSFIRRNVSDSDAADDILQDIFRKAAENLDTLSAIHNMGGWLVRAAKNRIIDYYRKRSTARKHEGEMLEDGVLHSTRQIQPSVEKAVMTDMMADALYDSLDELPPKQREVFILQAMEGYTFAEIAELTGESINTLMTRKRYALAFLRKRLIEYKEVLHDIHDTYL